MEVILVHGVPGCGKSPLARRKAIEWATATRYPILFVDPANVWTFKDIPHAKNIAEVIKAFQAGRSVAWGPDDPEDFDQFCGIALRNGKCIILVDELRYYANAHYCAKNLVLLARTYRHRSVGLSFVTQRINDLHSDVRPCLTEIYTGRCTAPRVLDYLASELGIKPQEVVTLPRNTFLLTREGFDDGQSERVQPSVPEDNGGHADPVHADPVHGEIASVPTALP
jgi:hypothetical protein